jgi:proliferating cell nuclear antigen
MMLIKASGEMSSVSIEMDKGSDAILEIDLRPETDPKTGQPAATTTPARATYNLNYLGEIIRAGSGASEVTSLEFSTNMPIKVEFEMPQQGRLLYYLAPRIEAE